MYPPAGGFAEGVPEVSHQVSLRHKPERTSPNVLLGLSSTHDGYIDRDIHRVGVMVAKGGGFRRSWHARYRLVICIIVMMVVAVTVPMRVGFVAVVSRAGVKVRSKI